jgi:hypothetical protein
MMNYIPKIDIQVRIKNKIYLYIFFFIFIDDVDDDQNMTYSKLSTARSGIINERDKIYDQSSRSYTSNERIQGKRYFN